MNKEETLHRIKEVEGQVGETKKTVLAERERIVRDARREAFDLRERLRRESEKRYEDILREADAATARETEKILEAGRTDAAKLRAQADTNRERAIDRLIEKFKGALNA